MNPLANIAVINVGTVNLHKVGQGRAFVFRSLIGTGQFIVQSCAAFFVKIGQFECFFIPADRGFRDALVEASSSSTERAWAQGVSAQALIDRFEITGHGVLGTAGSRRSSRARSLGRNAGC